MLSTSLRRVLVASGLVIASSFAASAAFAGTTGSIPLSGTVTTTLEMVATPTANTGMNLTTPSVQRVKVGDITMGTNNATGLNLALDSAVTFTNLNAKTPITVGVAVLAGASPTTPTTGYTTIAGSLIAPTAAQAVSTPYSLFVEYTPAALQDPIAYSATVSLTVTDNAD
ncbi:hypothetical protein APA_1212 [Pseudanabaena sp. lw0831]|uniref:hypothetical protein n=1 Tax=Pseudanabaena sp. lw0831 TaxID=1357935 RepID=UPI0019152EC4|nr:hypothetical protein [Pseudanabaena sp. lw0831]GBO53305.1 hypothetical protein APA_1212 [Pseudanabaena sp. lw0831]